MIRYFGNGADSDDDLDIIQNGPTLPLRLLPQPLREDVGIDVVQPDYPNIPLDLYTRAHISSRETPVTLHCSNHNHSRIYHNESTMSAQRALPPPPPHVEDIEDDVMALNPYQSPTSVFDGWSEAARALPPFLQHRDPITEAPAPSTDSNPDEVPPNSSTPLQFRPPPPKGKQRAGTSTGPRDLQIPDSRQYHRHFRIGATSIILLMMQ